MLIYETPVAPGGDPAGLDIESRVEGGPSAETLEATLAAVRGLGSKELTRLVGNVKTVPDNGARRGLPPVVCDESCRENCKFIYFDPLRFLFLVWECLGDHG